MDAAIGAAGMKGQDIMATYKTLAIVDDVNTCDCCGKSNLKSTVAMERDDGEVLYFGSVCAARHSGRDTKAIKSEAKAEHDRRVHLARVELRDSNEEMTANARMNEAHKAKLIGIAFREFCRATSDAASAKRAEIAAKYSLAAYAF